MAQRTSRRPETVQAPGRMRPMHALSRLLASMSDVRAAFGTRDQAWLGLEITIRGEGNPVRVECAGQDRKRFFVEG